MLVTVIVFLVILSVLVLIHEAGHFFAAKKFGIKVEEFGFGYPLTRPIFSVKRGETTYSFYPALIGGFVKLYGEDEAGSGNVSLRSQKRSSKDISRAFYARSVWQRATVILAGVFMNFVLAVAILSFLFGYQGVPALGDKVIISQVLPNSPAKAAGLKTGDIVLSINGKHITSSEQLVDITRNHLGKPIKLVVSSQESIVSSLEITPRRNYPSSQGPMGIAISQNVVTQKYPWYKAPFLGTKEALKESWLILSGLGIVLTQLIFHASIPAGVAGPVGIAQLTGQVVQTGTTAVLSFVALLSLNLAILNILPIPALDGGRLFFIIVEGVTRKKVNPKFEAYAHAVGMAILLFLILIITLHDFLRIFHGQPVLPQQ